MGLIIIRNIFLYSVRDFFGIFKKDDCFSDWQLEFKVVPRFFVLICEFEIQGELWLK